MRPHVKPQFNITKGPLVKVNHKLRITKLIFFQCKMILLKSTYQCTSLKKICFKKNIPDICQVHTLWKGSLTLPYIPN